MLSTPRSTSSPSSSAPAPARRRQHRGRTRPRSLQKPPTAARHRFRLHRPGTCPGVPARLQRAKRSGLSHGAIVAASSGFTTRGPAISQCNQQEQCSTAAPGRGCVLDVAVNGEVGELGLPRVKGVCSRPAIYPFFLIVYIHTVYFFLSHDTVPSLICESTSHRRTCCTWRG